MCSSFLQTSLYFWTLWVQNILHNFILNVWNHIVSIFLNLIFFGLHYILRFCYGDNCNSLLYILICSLLYILRCCFILLCKFITTYPFFYVDGHLGYFSRFTNINNAAWIFICMSPMRVSLGFMPEVEFLGTGMMTFNNVWRK